MSDLKPYPKPSYPQRAKTALHYLLPQHAITRAAGWFADKKWGAFTHAAINVFARYYKINWNEAAKPHPTDYASFNEFFTRSLKDGARPIIPEATLLCLPADGRVSECGSIDGSRLLQAKGHSFTLEDLLAGDKALAALFENGSFLTTYLSPRDYHRVHMPCEGTLRRMIYVPGELFSVNPFLARHIPNLFARNERVICIFDTAFGSMAQILVGATVTASISTVWAGIINPRAAAACASGAIPPTAAKPSASAKAGKWAHSASAQPSSTSSPKAQYRPTHACKPARLHAWANCSARKTAHQP